MGKSFEVMRVRKNILIVMAICGFAILATPGCSNTPPVVNANAQNGAAQPSPTVAATPSASPRLTAGGGDPIDTTKLDAEIAQAEKALEKKPNDEGARAGMAQAYLKRAGALTKARQYRSALGDYRRTLKYDPDNEEARNMSATIIGIMKQMGRDVPAEGEEPPPLPMKKEGEKTKDDAPKKTP